MKYKLILSNLSISSIFLIIFLIPAYFLWHPHSLDSLTGFAKSAKVLVLVNLVLGPLLLMLIYKKGKRNLKFDILIMATIQFIAILFGMYSIYQKHPVYAVFAVDRFTIINAENALTPDGSSKLFTIDSFSGPKLVFAKMPEDRKSRNKVLMDHLFKGAPDLDGLPEYYESYNKYISKVLRKGLDINKILRVKDYNNKLNQFLRKHGGNKNSYAYLPLQVNNRDVIWVLDINTAKPVGVLNIDPWQFVNQSKKLKTHQKLYLTKKRKALEV